MLLWLWNGIEGVPVEPGARQGAIFNKIAKFLVQGTLKHGSVPLQSVWGEDAAPNQPPGRCILFCSDNI